MPDYVCKGRLPEEVYCCEPGGSIDRDSALAQSCGPFFAPTRLMLERAAWQRYWGARLNAPLAGEFAWLRDPAGLAPERSASLASLLRALASMPPAGRADAENALLRVVLDGRGADSVRWFGSRLRVKTYSRHQPGRPQERLGGGAGWLADGTPVWFGGAGTSAGIFRKWGRQLAASLPPGAPAVDAGCVVVDFFARYPVRSLVGPHGPALPGPLHGRHVVSFENGQQLAFRANGSMSMLREGGRIRIRGRFGTNEYVARVLEREANARPRRRQPGPLRWPRAVTSSRTAARRPPASRSPTAVPPSALARIPPARQRWQSPPGPTAWWSKTPPCAITATPRGPVCWPGPMPCARPRPDKASTPSWRRPIRAACSASPGSGALPPPVRERNLARYGPAALGTHLADPAGLRTPAATAAGLRAQWRRALPEQSRNRVFMRPLATREDRITLAHEYLHIALRRHPRGQDETYVEGLARRLLDANLGSF
ncbi:DUF2300 domain-containing protein [Massilia sp. Dwa41.01b]|uniref:DUF2300 domain-containing protein n=1 Tax=Massilia sp. Dwa41.01b TaxID=2709302 RepID=UPI0016045E2A|nr:DUF2300 domain-containing protein [Massilia sp. Dwa41.01b]QNA89259.1 DUF2300 domain-containing protein [Massilia sp. Dwa41.01b]